MSSFSGRPGSLPDERLTMTIMANGSNIHAAASRMASAVRAAIAQQ
eukprot:CAMPEP_0115848654 /NCGR_PEP_ID=MMETSP0287-20121206/11037_1 /TAXON_ID=412157 /ORGANISM="Chrysochromulina rotalis, Strain UIO044" /LENGTH=45 /DNA_ID= /DNA_START= /DNA_END= /DNA_ORIENTATION=